MSCRMIELTPTSTASSSPSSSTKNPYSCLFIYFSRAAWDPRAEVMNGMESRVGQQQHLGSVWMSLRAELPSCENHFPSYNILTKWRNFSPPIFQPVMLLNQYINSIMRFKKPMTVSQMSKSNMQVRKKQTALMSEGNTQLYSQKNKVL